MRGRDSRSGGDGAGSAGAGGGAPGKRTLTQGLRGPILRRATGDSVGAELEQAGEQRAAERAQSLAQGGGTGLPEGDAGRLSQAFGHDLSGARIHTGAAAEASAGGLRARAFTLGSDVFMGAGEAPQGELLMHELAHVVQNERGQLPMTPHNQSVVSAPGDAVETAADHLAGAASAALQAGAPPAPMTPAAPLRAGQGTLVMRWAWDLPDGDQPLTDDEIQHLIEMQTVDFHLHPGEIADPRPFTNQRHRLVAAIQTIRQMMGSRLSTTWNAHQDDIGVRPTGYSSIFEYGAHLNEISGGDYRAFWRNQMTIRLAGWQDNLRVNPRTVYLAASAQVLMDAHDQSSVADQAGHGHFVATASVVSILNEMQHMLNTLAYDRHRPRTRPVDGGAAILSNIQVEMLRLLDQLAAQGSHEDRNGHQADEHLEPAMVRLMVGRIPAIAAVPQAPSDDQVPAVALQLLTELDHFPGMGAHEAGATDPHGTAHAMGVAYDMFDGSSANMWVGHAHRMWPFIYYLIRRYPGSGVSSNLDRVDGQSPDVLQNLAHLLHVNAGPAVRELREGQPAMWAADRADPHSEAERHHVATARTQLRAALQDRLEALRGASTLHLTPADQQRIELEMAAIAADLPAISDLTVADLGALTQRHVDALRRIVSGHPAPATAAPVELMSPLARLSPDAGRAALVTVQGTLAALPPHAQEAVSRGDEQAALGIVGDRPGHAAPGFESFLHDVQNSQIYDQSRVMVQAMQDVSGENSVQGMHHWQVVPMRGGPGNAEPATNTDAVYQQTLLRDMKKRTDAQLERILCVMAESPGGRQLLFGSPPDAHVPQVPDAELRAALDTRLPGGGDAMLARVRARVITPLEHSGRPTEGDPLRDNLRTMGIYLAAPPPAAAAATTGGPSGTAAAPAHPAHPAHPAPHPSGGSTGGH